jgi:hypothetical protein
MKKIYFFKLLLFLSLLLVAQGNLWSQQAIPNGNFETWEKQSILTPTGYVNSSLERPELADLGTCERVNDAQSGNYAIRLTTKRRSALEDEQPGYFANLTGEDGDPRNWHGGMPINEKPTGLRGYFKHDVKLGDSAFILVVFSKNGVNIGAYFYFISGQQTSYKEFNYTFTPALTQTPDSMIFGAVSSNVFNDIAIEGSMLQLDNISLTGIVNQPAQLNGNFENWTSVDIETPKNWYVESDNKMESVKTTDKYKGNYAIKLESYLSEDGSFTKVQESRISTGYYTPTSMEGGFPFSNTKDTLVFWYKYTTPSSSKASVTLTYKKAGSIIRDNRLELDPWNTNYKYVSYPIDLDFGPSPDTLIVSFSTLRNDLDQTNLANAGATLYLDEVQLTSQKLNTGLRRAMQTDLIKVYPNPATEALTILFSENLISEGASITIIDQLGKQVLTKNIEQTETQLSLQGLKTGLYNYLIKSAENKSQVGRLIVQ